MCALSPHAQAQPSHWDDGVTDFPPPGDGLHWNDKKNWEDDILPNGVIGAVLDTDTVRVGDGLQAFAATLDAGDTTLEINGQLTVNGEFSSTGTIIVSSESDNPNSGAGLRVGGGELQGEAEILLRHTEGPGVLPAVFSAIGAVTIGEDYEVRGEGRVGADGGGVLTNNGLVIAEDRDGNPGSNLLWFGSWVNNAEMRSSASASARIGNSITQTAAGRIVADANPINFSLGSVTGGVLDAENGGAFFIDFDGSISNLTNNAPINVVTGGTGIDLFVNGSGLTNNGVITINSDDNAGLCSLVFNTTQTLGGSGEVVLNRGVTASSTALSSSFAANVGAVVTQAAGHTIRGEGRISVELVNEGLIEAAESNGDGVAVLTIANNSNGSAGPTNNNLYRAADGATLEIIAQLAQGASGRIVAADGGRVSLRGATITDGAFDTEGAGVVELDFSSTLTNVTNEGVLNIPGGSSEKLLRISGDSFVNNGVLTARSTASGFGGVRIETSLELSGSGEIYLAAPVNSSTLTLNQNVTVVQEPGHTIRGRGQIVTNTGAALVNHGVLSGVSAAEPLEINPALYGAGLLRDVDVDSLHAPGDSPVEQATAVVPLEGAYGFGGGLGARSDNRLLLEIGGLTPGLEHDQLASTDAANQVVINTFNTTLDVRLVNGYVPDVGDVFTLIDTAGTISGGFQHELLPTAPNFTLAWDLSYSAQQLTLELVGKTALPGDYNGDGSVDAADYTVWRDTEGATGLAAFEGSDGNGDGKVDSLDYAVWVNHFGDTATSFSQSVPEAGALLLVAMGLTVLTGTRVPRHG